MSFVQLGAEAFNERSGSKTAWKSILCVCDHIRLPSDREFHFYYSDLEKRALIFICREIGGRKRYEMFVSLLPLY